MKLYSTLHSLLKSLTRQLKGNNIILNFLNFQFTKQCINLKANKLTFISNGFAVLDCCHVGTSSRYSFNDCPVIKVPNSNIFEGISVHETFHGSKKRQPHPFDSSMPCNQESRV